jgi:hypothetical protein
MAREMQCGLASRIPGAHDKDVAAFHGPHADDTADRDLPNSPYQKPIEAAPAAPLARRQRRRLALGGPRGAGRAMRKACRINTAQFVAHTG